MAPVVQGAHKIAQFSPLAFLYRLPGLAILSLKRQGSHLGLTLLALTGIVLAVSLVTNATFFAQAVDRVILLQELGDFSRVTGRPPFSTSAYIFPSQRAPLRLEEAERISQNIAATLSGEVGLPVGQLGLQVSSGGMMLQPGAQSPQYGTENNFLGTVSFVYIADAIEHLEIVDGEPFSDRGASSEVLDVWMHEKLAGQMGAKVGETLSAGVTLSGKQIPLRLAGFWRAADPTSKFWFTDPDGTLADALLVHRAGYINFVQPILPAGAREVNWYIILDDSKVIPNNSSEYLAGFQRGLKVINDYLPGTRFNTPPLAPLEDFVQRNTSLSILLLGFNLPALAVLLYFLVMTSSILAQWQRRETSLLASRGMSTGGILGLTLLEELLLFIIGCPLGIGLGMLIAWLMGYTASFLTFTSRPALPVTAQGLNFTLIIMALAFLLLARLWPTFHAARQSIVSEVREWARPTHSPFWYHYYLDLLLILPTYYAYRQITIRGSLAGLIVQRPEDLYQDPLLILLPALFIITTSLIMMRVFNLSMLLLDVIANPTPWLTLHLALRQLGRQGYEYIRPLLLVIVTLAIGVYTLSMAASLDQWLIDRIAYGVGADLALTPVIEGAEATDGEWIPLPGEFLKVTGVAGATRVSDLAARVDPPSGGEQLRGRLLAIDRLSFPQVAWYRKDLSAQSLGVMMNQLALAPDGVLVPQEFLERHDLLVGDPLSVLVSIETYLGARATFTIAGTYQDFPTVYPEEGVTLIGNLDQLTTIFGYVVPHNIWLDLNPGADVKAVLKEITAKVHIDAGAVHDAQALVATEQAKMERVGIFGTMSIGFLAAALMAVIGLLLYSYASLQERVYRFAIQNALGLSRRQIMTQVVIEYTFLAVFGSLAGAMIGAFASWLFIPYFRFTSEQILQPPALVPVIVQNQVVVLVILFSAVILFAEIVIIVWAFRQRLALLIKREWA